MNGDYASVIPVLLVKIQQRCKPDTTLSEVVLEPVGMKLKHAPVKKHTIEELECLVELYKNKLKNI